MECFTKWYQDCYPSPEEAIRRCTVYLHQQPPSTIRQQLSNNLPGSQLISTSWGPACNQHPHNMLTSQKMKYSGSQEASMAVCITAKKFLPIQTQRELADIPKKGVTWVRKCRNSAAAEQKHSKSYTLVLKVQLWP